LAYCAIGDTEHKSAVELLLHELSSDGGVGDSTEIETESDAPGGDGVGVALSVESDQSERVVCGG